MLPSSAGDVRPDHVVFDLESIDRMYLNLYVPQLQQMERTRGFIYGRLGRPIASTSVIAPMSRDFTARWPRSPTPVITETRTRVAWAAPHQPAQSPSSRSCASSAAAERLRRRGKTWPHPSGTLEPGHRWPVPASCWPPETSAGAARGQLRSARARQQPP